MTKREEKIAVQRYYIEAREKGYVGNCILWWGRERKGYVCDLNLAGVYSLEEAIEIEGTRRRFDDVKWPVEEIDALVKRHVTSLPRCDKTQGGSPCWFSRGHEAHGTECRF